VDLGDIVRAACDSARPAIDARRQRLELSVADIPGVVFGDADRLQQIVWNLLSNASKFTPPGGQIRVTLHGEASAAVLSVRDSGIGIPPEFLPHLFERFRQSDSTLTRAYGGLGLGLAIVRHLAELHGGSVSAASEGENRGASFAVRLPCRRVEQGAASANASRRDATQSA
jgi:signal transduction histidine kinase